METWMIVRCPVQNEFQKVIKDTIAHKPEPWLSHGNLCIESQIITPTKTLIFACANEEGKILGFTWLSLPDRQVITGWKTYAYIFHVYVESAFRGLGYGKKGVSLACNFARSAEVDGVVLATDDLGLRNKFYPSLGFRPIKPDPWLMKKIFRYKQRGNLIHPQTIFRRVSQHDLSTVQSICCQPHWIIEAEQVERHSAIEVEEEFCDLVTSNLEQYLVKGTYQDKPYTCWINKDQNGHYKQRILFLGKPIELNIISNVITEIAEKIKTVPNSQIHKKAELTNLLIVK